MDASTASLTVAELNAVLATSAGRLTRDHARIPICQPVTPADDNDGDGDDGIADDDRTECITEHKCQLAAQAMPSLYRLCHPYLVPHTCTVQHQTLRS